MLRRAIVLVASIALLVGCFVAGQRLQFGEDTVLSLLRVTGRTKVPATIGVVSIPTDDLAFNSLLRPVNTTLIRRSEPTASTIPDTGKDLYTADQYKRLQAELDHQLLSVHQLRERTAQLEWETLVLESDLLAREVELAEARAALRDRDDNKATVYNITNVPVGSYVVSEPPVSVPVAPPVVPADSEDVKSETQRPAFFGPAPDRYENLINPGLAETPHQDQVNSREFR